MAIINEILTDRKQAQHVKKVKNKNVQCQWSSRLPFYFLRFLSFFGIDSLIKQ